MHQSRRIDGRRLYGFSPLMGRAETGAEINAC
jgi:hypothetical protein